MANQTVKLPVSAVHTNTSNTGNTPTVNEPQSSSSAPRQRRVQLDEEKAMAHDHHEHLGTQVTSPGVRSQASRRSHISEFLHLDDNRDALLGFWDNFNRKGKRKIGVVESLKAIALSSWLNVLLIILPFAWASHWKQDESQWGHRTVFILSLLAIIPLEHLFDYGGDQMSFYLGKDIGDLLVVTLNNAVEATLGIILLLKCELVLLKSTIVGVVILHLLLVPGTAFVIGGSRIIQQDLHPHVTQLNHSMLTVGVLSLLLPIAFFSALNTSFGEGGTTEAVSIVSDEIRGKILQFSHGLAILLLIVYVCSRVYLHNPPGDDNALELHLAPNAPEAFKHEAEKFKREDPEVNQWVCMLMLVICIALMAATAEWLVESIEPVRERGRISEIWFGLILLPLVSFAGDGLVAIVFFIRRTLRHFFNEPIPPPTLAQAEAIDLSIQFVLFWMPLFVLIAWWSGRPLTLLFDLFEVALLVGSCFLVNYVTADAKTNWAEGTALVIFYIMIALVAWFYDGQPEVRVMSECGTVAAALAAAAGGGDSGGVHTA